MLLTVLAVLRCDSAIMLVFSFTGGKEVTEEAPQQVETVLSAASIAALHVESADLNPILLICACCESGL